MAAVVVDHKRDLALVTKKLAAARNENNALIGELNDARAALVETSVVTANGRASQAEIRLAARTAELDEVRRQLRVVTQERNALLDRGRENRAVISGALATLTAQLDRL